MTASKHLVLIPTYNTGAALLLKTVREAMANWPDVWVVVDGSTDGSEACLLDLSRSEPRLKVVVRQRNQGKGAAVLAGAEAALAAGYTHALVMDADGQHPANRIGDFMSASASDPEALVLGRPLFGPEAPLVRLKGRKISIALVHFETGGEGIDDPLFGFRVYPLAATVRVLNSTRFAKRYDFDPEVAVRLFWMGTPMRNIPASCRYIARENGGVSHFHYVRDNIRMVWLHTRLITELLLWRWVAVRRLRRKPLEAPIC